MRIVAPLRRLSSAALPPSPFPILTSVSSVRSWRSEQKERGKRVGFVPTMGALHKGHLDLVNASLQKTDSTVVSIFVNPSQFAPHEDLSTYPRTLNSDVSALSSLSLPSSTTYKDNFALFLPPVSEMYPTGIVQDVSQQRGAFVEVSGLQSVLEGWTRPTFFRGVATVVTKLFNIVTPDTAFFGQKDIQQALLLRRMLKDLHFSYPTPERLVICPTTREGDGLAMSSRNAYLSPAERKHATILHRALRRGEAEIAALKQVGLQDARRVKSIMENCIEEGVQAAATDGVSAKRDYVAVCGRELDDLTEETEKDARGEDSRAVVLVGAIWVGKTRLIDNLVVGWNLNAAS
ncbi:Pantoate-beta-alanine ligase [Atractiella rhizophila]|nr:Pantoate-beta-alanine ligase [Atractiella rhizophila]